MKRPPLDSLLWASLKNRLEIVMTPLGVAHACPTIDTEKMMRMRRPKVVLYLLHEWILIPRIYFFVWKCEQWYMLLLKIQAKSLHHSCRPIAATHWMTSAQRMSCTERLSWWGVGVWNEHYEAHCACPIIVTVFLLFCFKVNYKSNLQSRASVGPPLGLGLGDWLRTAAGNPAVWLG